MDLHTVIAKRLLVSCYQNKIDKAVPQSCQVITSHQTLTTQTPPNLDKGGAAWLLHLAIPCKMTVSGVDWALAEVVGAFMVFFPSSVA